jgi:hypothetical protein
MSAVHTQSSVLHRGFHAGRLLSELQTLNHSRIMALPKNGEVASGSSGDTTNRRFVSATLRARGLVRLQPTLAQTTIDIVCDNAAATSPTRQLWVARSAPPACYDLQTWHRKGNAKIARTSFTMLVCKEGMRRVCFDAFAYTEPFQENGHYPRRPRRIR